MVTGSGGKADWLARLQITAVFVTMLVGGFSVARLGLTPLPFSEPVLITLFVGLLFVPMWFASRPSDNHAGQPWRTLGLVALLLIVIVVSSAWGPVGHGTTNLIGLLVLMAIQLSLAAMAIALAPRAAAHRLIWLFAGVGVSYAIIGLVSGQASDRLSVLGGGPNVFGRMVALGIIALVGLIMLAQITRYSALLLPMMFYALILSGSRGATSAALVGIAILVVLPRGDRYRLAIAALMCGVAAVIWTRFSTSAIESVEGVIRTRIFELLVVESDYSGRGELFAAAWRIFKEHPIIGGGLGSFTHAVGFDTYPHNLVLSVLASTGLLGGSILAWLLTTFVRSFIGSRRDPTRYVVLALASVVFVSAMFSGGLFDSRFFWLLLMMAATLASSPGRDTEGTRELARVRGANQSVELERSPGRP